MPGTAARAVTWSRRAEPCRNQRRSIVAPCRLNDENSRAKLQNVREESSDVLGRRARSCQIHQAGPVAWADARGYRTTDRGAAASQLPALLPEGSRPPDSA